MSNNRIFSIVIPIYQNADNLNETIPALLDLQKKLIGYKLELIFVDDGSTDGSYGILRKYFEIHRDKIIIIKLTKNFGQISAIQVGLRVAKGDCIGIISADMQDPHELFIDMIKRWETGVKLVIGERAGREEEARKSILSRFCWGMVNRFAVNNYPLGGYDFCLIDRQIVNEVNNINEKNTHIFILIFSLGYKYEIIPYIRKERTAGKSRWTFPKKIKLFIDIFISFSYTPIRAIACLGLILAILSFIYGFFMIVNTIIFGNKYPGWTTIVVLITFFGGIILITLGIIGEYLWRILDEVRKRPNYVIEEIVENKQGI
ncbi:MAG: glycosyltransferase family 2 protein [Candidatus Omnitrophica bacterium]|jgi:dolichol-phosphate mannosyltransferase|nr:glycosyltransferase family 2 protein [Candidatus Omnitrophota bacterium]